MTAQTVAEVMAPRVTTVSVETTAEDAARWMRDEDIGDVIVVEGNAVKGIVTDRDLVVRVLAEKRNPHETPVGEICTDGIIAVMPEDPLWTAVRLMRETAIRRLPVIDKAGHPVGVISLGDIAMYRDPSSTLSDISSAPPNN